MEDMEPSAMIALLPVTSDWCELELPHMTLVYVGPLKSLKPTTFNELAKDASSLAQLTPPLYLRVKGVEQFDGWKPGEPKVDVLRLQPTQELLAMRRFVEDWNASEHPFNPHCTIGPSAGFRSNVPSHLAFDKLCVGWGDEYLTFGLKR